MSVNIPHHVGFEHERDTMVWNKLLAQLAQETDDFLTEFNPDEFIKAAEIEAAYAQDKGHHEDHKQWESVRYRRRLIKKSLKEVPADTETLRVTFCCALVTMVIRNLLLQVKNDMLLQSSKKVLLGAVLERAQELTMSTKTICNFIELCRQALLGIFETESQSKIPQSTVTKILPRLKNELSKINQGVMTISQCSPPSMCRNSLVKSAARY